MADFSKLISSLTLIAQIACWQFDTWIHILEQKAFFWTIECWKKDLGALEIFRIGSKSFLEQKQNKSRNYKCYSIILDIVF